MIVKLVLWSLTRGTFALPVGTLSRDEFQRDSQCTDLGHCRSISDIVWSCLGTIFACTWIAIHPNIPPASESFLVRRAKIFVVALIAPELVVFWAFRQWLASCRLARKYDEFGWTRTHGFFALMGGFAQYNDDHSWSALNPYALRPHLRNNSIKSTRREILDRSKGDILAKSLVLIQVTWFILQFLARAIEHLSITELEVVTLAFAILNFMTYFCWWNKPLDVQCPIRVHVDSAVQLDGTPTGSLILTGRPEHNDTMSSLPINYRMSYPESSAPTEEQHRPTFPKSDHLTRPTSVPDHPTKPSSAPIALADSSQPPTTPHLVRRRRANSLPPRLVRRDVQCAVITSKQDKSIRRVSSSVDLDVQDRKRSDPIGPIAPVAATHDATHTMDYTEEQMFCDLPPVVPAPSLPVGPGWSRATMSESFSDDTTSLHAQPVLPEQAETGGMTHHSRPGAPDSVPARFFRLEAKEQDGLPYGLTLPAAFRSRRGGRQRHGPQKKWRHSLRWNVLGVGTFLSPLWISLKAYISQLMAALRTVIGWFLLLLQTIAKTFVSIPSVLLKSNRKLLVSVVKALDADGAMGDPCDTFYFGHLSRRERLVAYTIASSTATIFGAIHCIAWSFQFPSDAEKLIWRASSITVTCLPVYGFLYSRYTYIAGDNISQNLPPWVSFSLVPPSVLFPHALHSSFLLACIALVYISAIPTSGTDVCTSQRTRHRHISDRSVDNFHTPL